MSKIMGINIFLSVHLYIFIPVSIKAQENRIEQPRKVVLGSSDIKFLKVNVDDLINERANGSNLKKYFQDENNLELHSDKYTAYELDMPLRILEEIVYFLKFGGISQNAKRQIDQIYNYSKECGFEQITEHIKPTKDRDSKLSYNIDFLKLNMDFQSATQLLESQEEIDIAEYVVKDFNNFGLLPYYTVIRNHPQLNAKPESDAYAEPVGKNGEIYIWCHTTHCTYRDFIDIVTYQRNLMLKTKLNLRLPKKVDFMRIIKYQTIDDIYSLAGSFFSSPYPILSTDGEIGKDNLNDSFELFFPKEAYFMPLKAKTRFNGNAPDTWLILEILPEM